MAQHNITGKEGEDVAVQHLLAKGYRLIARNWEYLKNELDIIAENDQFIIVAEVKTRGTNVFGEPEDFVDLKKQRRMIKAANAFVLERNIEKEVRFDIISVIAHPGGTAITHIEDAFYPLV